MAAKEKTFLLIFVIASALFVCAPAIASSTHVSTAENRVEIFLLEGQNRTGQQAFESANRVENYDSRWGVASESPVAPKGLVNHVTTSGAKLVPNPNKTTTVIGAYGSDLKHIMNELGVPAQTGHLDHILHGLKGGNKGGFNFLNVSEDVYNAGVHRGGFFSKINAAWIDDAVARGDDILVVSSKKFLRDDFGELTGFGKEVKRLIDVHGYRWNSDFTRLLPPVR